MLLFTLALANMARTESASVKHRRSVLAIDTVVTVLLALLFAYITIFTSNTPGLLVDCSSMMQTLWSCILMIPVAWRRTQPQKAALIYVGLVVVHLVIGPVTVMPDYLALLMVYSVIVYGDPRHTKAFITLAFLMAAVAAVAITWAEDVGPLLDAQARTRLASRCPQCSTVYSYGLTRECATTLLQESAFLACVIALCLMSTIVIAYWQRARHVTIRMMQERNEAIAARQEEEQHTAALAERARIARDMHDVVAHTLSIIIVQSDGGRYAGAHNPQVARSTMETIQRESERALHDMTRLFEVFHDSSHDSYDDIDALINQARTVAADCHIQRHIYGQPDTSQLSPDASSALYHLVQEALTNVRKYAGPQVTVRIYEHWNDDGVAITVVDNGRGAAAADDGHQPGYGLLGIRERMAAVGGSVVAGPRNSSNGGGFEVHAALPYKFSTAERHTPSSPSSSQPSPQPSSQTSSQTSQFSSQPSPQPSSETPSQPSLLFLPRPWQANTINRISRISARLLSQPIDQATSAEGKKFNRIERLSQWCERHYVLMDTIMAICIIKILSIEFLLTTDFSPTTVQVSASAPYEFVTVMTVAPLVFRRRFPEASALFIAVFCAFQLIVMSVVPFANVLVLVAVFSMTVYGRPYAWLRAGLACVIDSCLLGLSMAAQAYGYSTLYEAVLQQSVTDNYYEVMSARTAIFIGIFYTAVVLIMCCSTIALGRWTRARGANVLILQAREEALKAEQEQQRILAANMERNRISVTIQAEVADTLHGVINQAEAGLRMFDECAERGDVPSAESISSAFESIGRQGRDALAHMRQLLAVLRETGFSDSSTESRDQQMRLTPAKSLEEQLRDVSS